MIKKFGYNARPQGNMICMFGEIPEAGRLATGLTVSENPFQCCGLKTLSGFNGYTPITEWADKAAWLAALWQLSRGMQHYVYVVNPTQDIIKSREHGALLECGAKLICEFPNLQPGHGGYHLKMYMCNLNDGIGRFFNVNGVAYTEPPKTELTAEKGKTIQVVAPTVAVPVASPVASPVAAPRVRKTVKKESA